MSLATSLLGGIGSTGSPGIILAPVVAGTTTALTVTYANGASGIGATLTNAGVQAAFSIDGISPTVGQRVLVKDQASALQNGVYVVSVVGSGATNWVLVRSTDFDEPAEMQAGVQVDVAGGTVNAATTWVLSLSVAAVGVNSVVFVGASDAGYTPSRALVTNAGGRVVVSTTTSTEIGYVNGVTSAIQTQLNTIQTGSQVYAADAGVTDAYAITLSPVPSGYTIGMGINFKANTANTGTATLNVNTLGPITIVKAHDQTLVTGDIESGQIVTVIYDGTNFQMQSQIGINQTASRAVVTDSAGSFTTAATTSTEIGYVSGVTSAIQTQIDGKIGQSGAQIYAADGGSTDAYAITLSPAPAGYTTGMVVNFKANTANTGACTLNVNSLGAIAIKKQHDLDPVNNDIEVGQIVTVVYDGTNFQMQSQVAYAFAYTNQTATSVTVVSNTGYVTNAGASLVTYTLPAGAVLGDFYEIIGASSGGWKVQANTGQIVNVLANPTSTAGSVSSQNRYDCIKIVCTTDGTTFSAIPAGNLTTA